MAERWMAAYCRCQLSCTMNSMIMPAKATAVAPRMNTNRMRILSEIAATVIEDTNEHTQGGTESSCVWIALLPKVWMIVGVNNAGRNSMRSMRKNGSQRDLTVAVSRSNEAEVHKSTDDDPPCKPKMFKCYNMVMFLYICTYNLPELSWLLRT